MNNLFASFVALTLMATAASADSLAPTRLTDKDLDEITAGLNINTPFLAVQTNCGNCILEKQAGDPSRVSYGFAQVYNYDDTSVPADGRLVASYAGPLRIIGAGLAIGSGPNPEYGNVMASAFAGDSAARSANAGYVVSDGTVGAVAYNGPLGIVQAAGVVVEADGPFTGAYTNNPSLLSINGLGGHLVLPTGGGRQAAIEGRVSIGAPGL